MASSVADGYMAEGVIVLIVFDSGHAKTRNAHASVSY